MLKYTYIKERRGIYSVRIQGPISNLMMATYVLPKHVALFTCMIKVCMDCNPTSFFIYA